MLKIIKRKVTKSEAELLIREIKQTPNILSYSLAEWMIAEHTMVAENEEGKMLGVCLNYDFHKRKLSCYAPKVYIPNMVKSCGVGILPARIIQIKCTTAYQKSNQIAIDKTQSRKIGFT